MTTFATKFPVPEGNGAQKNIAIQIPETRVKHKPKAKRVDTSTKGVVEFALPYSVDVQVSGTEDMLCHRYDGEVVKSKNEAKKGSVEKKSDNIESYVYRDKSNNCCIPGFNIKSCLQESAKYSQDPRSPRKSAKDIVTAGIRIPGDISLGKKTWDYVDKRGVGVNMARITRHRPAFKAGWKLKFVINVLLPEYITPDLLNEILTRAGKVIGLGDFRPDFGLFRVDAFKVLAA